MFREIVLCFFLVPVSVLRDQRHQTLTGTKKTTTTRCTKPSQAPKKTKNTNPSIYSGFWTPHACQCFVRLCFVVFVFSCLPMFFEHHYKTKCKKMRLGFRAIRCRKHRYLQCFVFIFMQKLRPWSPALRKNGSQLLLFRGVGVQIYTQHVSVYIHRFHLK